MIASAHIAAGSVAAMAASRVTKSRALGSAAAFAFGLVTHAILDAIPHSDYQFLSRTAVRMITIGEGVVMLSIITYLLRDRMPRGWLVPMAAGIVGGCILDAKFPAQALLPERMAIWITQHGDAIHRYFHARTMTRPLIGLVNEVVATVLLLVILTRFRRLGATDGAGQQ